MGSASSSCAKCCQIWPAKHCTMYYGQSHILHVSNAQTSPPLITEDLSGAAAALQDSLNVSTLISPFGSGRTGGRGLTSAPINSTIIKYRYMSNPITHSHVGHMAQHVNPTWHVEHACIAQASVMAAPVVAVKSSLDAVVAYRLSTGCSLLRSRGKSASKLSELASDCRSMLYC